MKGAIFTIFRFLSTFSKQILGEDAIRQGNAIKLVEHASALARLGNRVLQVGRQEAENSEDPRFISSLNYSADQLHSSMSVFYII